jgi:hypothetical protein
LREAPDLASADRERDRHFGPIGVNKDTILEESIVEQGLLDLEAARLLYYVIIDQSH